MQLISYTSSNLHVPAYKLNWKVHVDIIFGFWATPLSLIEYTGSNSVCVYCCSVVHKPTSACGLCHQQKTKAEL